MALTKHKVTAENRIPLTIRYGDSSERLNIPIGPNHPLFPIFKTMPDIVVVTLETQYGVTNTYKRVPQPPDPKQVISNLNWLREKRLAPYANNKDAQLQKQIDYLIDLVERDIAQQKEGS